MSEAPNPTELATTQLLPYLAVGGNEEAWRAFVVRYRPRILRWCRRLQADDAEEVASRVLHKLVVGLARGVYRRHDPGTFRGWLRRVVGNEVVHGVSLCFWFSVAGVRDVSLWRMTERRLRYLFALIRPIGTRVPLPRLGGRMTPKFLRVRIASECILLCGQALNRVRSLGQSAAF